MPYGKINYGKKDDKKKKAPVSGLEKMIVSDTSGDNTSSIIPKQKVKYKGNVEDATMESDVQEEMSETLRQFKESIKNELDKRADNTDTNFYSTIVFNNSRQREKFFKAIGVSCTEKTNLRFINGVKLAEVMGIELPASTSNEAGRFKVNRELLSFCINPKKSKK